MQGFQQKEGINYAETFAFVVKPMSYKAIFVIAAAKNWHVHQINVKTAFLYGFIEGEVYVCQSIKFDNLSGNIYKL